MRSAHLWPVLALSILLGGGQGGTAEDVAVWQEFVAAVRQGRVTEEMIRPYDGLSSNVLLQQLLQVKRYHDEYQSWSEWDHPQVFRVGNQVHFIVAFTFGGRTKSDFCFSLLTEGGRWHFRHLENIFIRLDAVTTLPASEFPDLPAEKKAWQREEIYWSQVVFLHTVLAKEKGKEYLAGLLRDGKGYFLAARTWVPFVPPERAFILYLCWEQQRLRENAVTLESLSETAATVRLQAQFFALYRQTGHLKTQIAFADYRRFFETIWQDRAAAAGWTLTIGCEDPGCLTTVLQFRRDP